MDEMVDMPEDGSVPEGYDSDNDDEDPEEGLPLFGNDP